MATEYYGKAIRFYSLLNIGELIIVIPKFISILLSLRESQKGNEAGFAYLMRSLRVKAFAMTRNFIGFT
jgi:hypothetical protein